MAAGSFYFSWAGAAMNPSPPVTTTGDTHGSIAQTFATVGDLLGGALVENIADINGLVVGSLYGIIDGEGLIPAGTTFVYLGGNSLSLSQGAAAPATSVTLVITAPVVVAQTTGSIGAGSTVLALDNTGGLEVGSLYSVVGQGIPAGTLFVYGGSAQVTMSLPAAMTQSGVALLISGLVPNDPFTVDNIDTTGLVAGQQYLIAGPGIPAGTSFIAPGGGTAITLDQAATSSGVAVPLFMVGPLVPDAPFDVSQNLVHDEAIFSIDLSQNEGDFAALKIVVRNPRIGLLAAGRQIWSWLSWDSGAGIVQLFNGRLVGIPKNLAGETVELEFIACPNDYRAQKLALAQTMQVLPYWDPVWLSDRLYDPDTILETQPILWHIDRVSLAVTVSNINVGEDGTAVLREPDHFYQDLEVSYGQPPLTAIDVTGTVSWTQQGDGLIDVTPDLVDAFASPASASWSYFGFGNGTIGAIELTDQAITGAYRVVIQPSGAPVLLGAVYAQSILFAVINPRGQAIGTGEVGGQFSQGGITFTLSAGSVPFAAGDEFTITVDGANTAGSLGGNLIATLTGDGLKSSWPRAGQSIGSGWNVGPGSSIDDANFRLPPYFIVPFMPVPGMTIAPKVFPLDGLTGIALSGALTATFTVSVFEVVLQLQYLAARPRTETVRFALTADIQPLVTDPGSSLEDSISLQSQAVAQAVDPGGAIPIGDLRRASYFQTDRGAGSFEFLLLMARAKLLARARAVKITFGTSFANAVGLTCRMNVELHDRRLPGGVATGKIESYRLTASAHDGQRAMVTIGCTIGNGSTFAAAAGVPVYTDSYAADSYQVSAGAQIDLIPGEVNYETLDDFVIDDDGVDLFNMTPQSVIQSLIVTNGFDRQARLLAQNSLFAMMPMPRMTDPIGQLTQAATGVDLELVPLTGSFGTQFTPAISLMGVPQTIDLAAPALGI